MLLGTFREIALTAEGLVVPVPLRAPLAQGFVITRGLDRCVAVFPLSEWESLMKRIERGPSFLRGAVRLFERHVYGGASADSLASEGWMKIPAHLREYAELDSEVVVVGVATRIEIWNADRWQEEETSLKEQAAQISEGLSEFGI